MPNFDISLSMSIRNVNIVLFIIVNHINRQSIVWSNWRRMAPSCKQLVGIIPHIKLFFFLSIYVYFNVPKTSHSNVYTRARIELKQWKQNTYDEKKQKCFNFVCIDDIYTLYLFFFNMMLNGRPHAFIYTDAMHAHTLPSQYTYSTYTKCQKKIDNILLSL